MNKIKILIAAFSIFALFSCEKTVDNVELPDIQPVLVAQSFLEVGADSVKVFLSRSNPIFYSTQYGFKDVTDAQVILTNGSQSISLTYQAGGSEWMAGYYFAPISSFSLDANKSYTLKIKSTLGDSVFSTCILPETPNVDLKLVSLDSTLSEWDTRYYYNYTFELLSLNSQANNYYHIEAMGYSTDNGNNYADRYMDYSVYGLYKMVPNKKELIVFEAYNKVDSFDFHVLKTDEAYYNYHRSVNDFEGDNPFAEPVIIYSNIENGLGIFCGFNRKKYTVLTP